MNVAIDFELINASDENQVFVLEITMDDADHGYVEEMALLKNGIVVYALKNPAPFAKRTGHSVYRGRKVMVEPERDGIKYKCRSSWVMNRGNSDMWYNHMMLPTVGMSLETHAPPEYEITSSSSNTNLIMTGEHLDVAWAPRKLGPRRT